MNELRQWLNVSTPLARAIVRKIIQDAHPEPLHTQRIYALSQTVKLTPEQERTQDETHARLLCRTGPPPPPNPTHPIRSVRYLKKVVLEDLAARKEIVKIVHTRPTTELEHHPASFRTFLQLSSRNSGEVGPGRQYLKGAEGKVTEYAWRLWTSEDEERLHRKEERREQAKALRLQRKQEKAMRRRKKTR